MGAPKRERAPAPPAGVVDAPKSRPLWAITPDVEELAAVLIGRGGELSEDEEGQAIEAWLADVQAEHHTKLDGYGRMIGWFEAQARAEEAELASVMAEAARLQARYDRAAKTAEEMRTRLRSHFQRLGERRIETGRYTFVLGHVGGKLAIIRHVPEEMLPGHIRKETWTLVAPGTVGENIRTMLIHMAVELNEKTGVDITWTMAAKLDDAAARVALDAALAARQEREERMQGLVEGLGMEEAEAGAQCPPTEAEEVLQAIGYGPRKVVLKIT